MTPRRDSNEHWTPDEVAQAILDAGGLLSHAAKALGCSRMTVYRYIDRHDECREAVEVARQQMLDDAERELRGYAFQREEVTDQARINALKFLLDGQGVSRGFGRKSELQITGSNGGPVEIEVAVDRQLPDES